MVKPAVLRQYAPVMAEIFKMPSLLDLTESNPDIDWRQILSTLALPNWTYYTDVALGKQGKRASLNPCLSNNESSAPICAIGPVGSTPVSSVTSTSIEATPEQICTAVLPVSKRLSSASTGPPSGQRSLLACFQDSVGNENTLPMTYTSEAHALELEDLIILEPSSSSSATQAVSVAGTTSPADQFPDSSRNSLTPGLTRKRITLECFFTPATPHLAKRRRARSQNEATEIEEKDKTDNVNEPSPCVALDYIVID
ncbi:unnamed protein product [Protopolystoma xenopodis]|uniref:Uncharacterized protein n=1 Tax=Protopolystoma xenopodis TaxID=117903 RepID=A0A3S4ZQY6_9PLAT|nr:unnamed protein product [Protopolystoma xenopodis]